MDLKLKWDVAVEKLMMYDHGDRNRGHHHHHRGGHGG